MPVTSNNVWLTDLEVGDEVIEQFFGAIVKQYVSKVSSIDDQFIVTTLGNKYDTSSGRIVYPINLNKISNAFLLQKKYSTDGTPFDPEDVSEDSQVLIPDVNDKNFEE